MNAIRKAPAFELIEIAGPVGKLECLRLDSALAETRGIVLVAHPNPTEGGTFELSAKDITLFKRHPEASSARNLLACQVTDIFGAGNRVGVELTCPGGTLVCQIVPEAADELGLKKGSPVVAAVKASAFNRVF